MREFWRDEDGKAITGNAQDSFSPDFQVIPEGTCACAAIVNLEIAEKEENEWRPSQKYYEVTWALTDGEFKGRKVSQKIKAFVGSPPAITRNKNMLKRVMVLTGFTPPHEYAPSAEELSIMIGKVCGIKVGEWSLEKKDGSGKMEGNFVREVHAAKDFVTKTGKREIPDYVEKKPPVKQKSDDEIFSDLPF